MIFLFSCIFFHNNLTEGSKLLHHKNQFLSVMSLQKENQVSQVKDIVTSFLRVDTRRMQ